jgi:DNA-binding NtrC family response regulator
MAALPARPISRYHAALVKRDAQATRRTLSPGNLEVYDGAQKKNDLDSYLSYLAGKQPMKEVKITRGWATPTKASLLVEGESSAGKVAGEVFLINSQGKWGVDEELVDLVLGR